jgi:hypothetical protein
MLPAAAVVPAMAQNIKPKAIPFRITSPPWLSAKPYMRPGEAAKNNADNDSRWAIVVAGFELSLQIRWQEEFVGGFWMLDKGSLRN